MIEQPKRGRPRKFARGRSSIDATESTRERSIDRDAAIKMVAEMSEQFWTYKQLAEAYDKKPAEAIELMNDLLHYGLMVFCRKQNKHVPVFERCPYVKEKF